MKRFQGRIPSVNTFGKASLHPVDGTPGMARWPTMRGCAPPSPPGLAVSSSAMRTAAAARTTRAISICGRMRNCGRSRKRWVCCSRILRLPSTTRITCAGMWTISRRRNAKGSALPPLRTGHCSCGDRRRDFQGTGGALGSASFQADHPASGCHTTPMVPFATHHGH